MKIALFENLMSGGSKREAHEFARQFVRAGHTVDLFTASTADSSFLPFEEIISHKHEYPLTLVNDRPLRVPGLTQYFGLAALYRNLHRLKCAARAIAAQIDDGGYDFVFAHHDQLVQGPYLFHYLNCKSVYFCAEPMRRFYEPHISRDYLQPQSFIEIVQRAWYAPARMVEADVIRRADRQNVGRADLLMTNSCFSAESIYKAYGRRARVVYLGVDTETFSPSLKPREPYLLSVGSINPLKGYDFLIQSIGTIPDWIRPRLVLVGNTASIREKCHLEMLAKQSGVNLQLLVNVTERELVDLYRRAKLLVYAPILEPFGLAPLEAMACETPVVGIREGGVRESVVDGETGTLVDRSPADFGEAISQLLTDESKRKRMGQAARTRVLSFWTWEQAYKRFHTVVKRFLDERTSRPCSESA